MKSLRLAAVSETLRHFGLWRMAAVGLLLVFAVAIGRFYEPGKGFTSLLSIGSYLGTAKVSSLRTVPHHVYEQSYGYDGAYYVQIALHPTLDNPELAQAIDNLHYRAKRILLSWAAWLLGFGQPDLIVNVFPLINVACWAWLAWLLWRRIPPTDLDALVRWGGILFSHGVCMSVRHSLTDLPALVLVVVAFTWWEKERRASATAALAAAVLAKETSVLATVLFAKLSDRGLAVWARAALRVLVVVLPVAAWMIYLRYHLGPSESSGFNNFTAPGAGWWQKLGVLVADLRKEGWMTPYWQSFGVFIALTVQGAFLLLWWRPENAWWRLGVMFAVMMLFVSQPVWEGYPGAATRVLLPMSLAFNLLVPKGRKWLPVLLAGNLSVAAGVAELTPPAPDFYRIVGESRSAAAVELVRGEGWYAPEWHRGRSWRWGRESAKVRLVNSSDKPVVVTFDCELSGITNRHFGFRFNGQQLYDAPLYRNAKPHRLPTFTLPPGVHDVEFATDQPAIRPDGNDPREMSLCVSNLVITVAPLGQNAQR